MKINIYKDEREMAQNAAEFCKDAINTAIDQNGLARIVVSTGASQLPFFEEFVKQDIDFSRVEMFHLDEYIGADESHVASFKKYLRERFVDKVNLLRAHLIDGNGNSEQTIQKLTKEINRAPIDLGLIGIGENAHIAFNDPPADFEDNAAYKIVALNAECKAQQVREKWFASEDEVFEKAITMTCRQIMKCKKILSIVPYEVKAQAVYNMITHPKSVMVPATLLKEHPDFTLMLDNASASLYERWKQGEMA